MSKNIAIVLSGDPKVPNSVSSGKRTLHGLVDRLIQEKYNVQTVIYNDNIVAEVEEQLQSMDAILVWVNPIENGISRTILDGMLKRLADQDIFISTHPDIILQIGTKEVLYKTREFSWGSDVEIYSSLEEFKTNIVPKLQRGISRVLKQNRGNGGNGVWRIDWSKENRKSNQDPFVKVLHAVRDSKEEEMLLSAFIEKIKGYFDNAGKIIDQEFINPEPEGAIRCYMTQNKVVGFGQQYVKALLRPKNPQDTIETPPRIYFSKDKPEYQDLRFKMEQEWIPQLLKELHLEMNQLPIIWDTDFLFRSNNQDQLKDQYVLGEINVSSVYPFPDYAVPDIFHTIKTILH